MYNLVLGKLTMRNLFAILICLLVLGISLFTGLFQTVPFGHDDYMERVFSEENIRINALLLVGASVLVGLLYWVKHIFQKKEQKNRENKRGQTKPTPY